jgi:hypothetical protein
VVWNSCDESAGLDGASTSRWREALRRNIHADFSETAEVVAIRKAAPANVTWIDKARLKSKVRCDGLPRRHQVTTQRGSQCTSYFKGD